jgi:hypothetical protein
MGPTASHKGLRLKDQSIGGTWVFGGQRVLNTNLSYKLITKDLEKSLDRVENQPLVNRDTKYYLENIGKVTTVDEFLKDDRLYKYAMKAYGLEDMIYAKAFIKKALKEGVSSTTSFANKLTDTRYRQFVASFNFAANGADATSYNKAQQQTVKNYATQAEINGVKPDSAFVKTETAYYLANIGQVKSVDDLMNNSRLYTYALAAYGLDNTTESKTYIRSVLEGGVRNADSVANKDDNPAYAALASAFNFEQYGEDATTIVTAQQPTVDKYLRQTLEENAGKENEGVRLALYFERKASGLTNFYEVLADKALASVVRTALSLPDEFAQTDVDKQVKYFESKLKIEDFKDTKKLDKFLQRYTSLYELRNPTSTVQSQVAGLFSQSTASTMSTNLLLAMQSMKR